MKVSGRRDRRVKIEIVRLWSAARVLSGPFHEGRELRVHVHGQGVLFLSRLSDRVDIARVPPSHEDLRGGFPEHFAPGIALRVELSSEFRRKLSPFCDQLLVEFPRNSPGNRL